MQVLQHVRVGRFVDVQGGPSKELKQAERDVKECPSRVGGDEYLRKNDKDNKRRYCKSGGEQVTAAVQSEQKDWPQKVELLLDG